MDINSFQKLGLRRGIFLVNFAGLLRRFGHKVVLNDDSIDISYVTNFNETTRPRTRFARKRAI